MAVAKKNTRKSTPKSQSQSASTTAAPKTTRTKKTATVATPATSETSETKAATVKTVTTKRASSKKATPSATNAVKKVPNKSPVAVVTIEEKTTIQATPEISKEIMENQSILTEIIESVVAEEKEDSYFSEDKSAAMEIIEPVEVVAQGDKSVATNEAQVVEPIGKTEEVEKEIVSEITEEKVEEVSKALLNTEAESQIDEKVLSAEEDVTTDAVSADIPPVIVDVVDTREDNKADEIEPVQITEEILEEIVEEITEVIADEITAELTEEVVQTSTIDEIFQLDEATAEARTQDVSDNFTAETVLIEELSDKEIPTDALATETNKTIDTTDATSLGESSGDLSGANTLETDENTTIIKDKPDTIVSAVSVQSEESHTEKVNSMFSSIKRYDFLNHFLSMGLDYLWRREMISALTLSEEPRVLDMAAGTLDVSLSLLRKNPKVQIVAGDICQDMLSYGEKKIRYDEKSRIECQVMDAREIPFEDNSFEAVTIAFGIRNVDDRLKALREMRRVLVNGGQLCVLEFAPMTTPYLGKAYHWYLDNVTPQIASLFGEEKEPYEYLAKTIKEFLNPTEFCQELRDAGFNLVRHKCLTFGVAHLYYAIKN